MSKVRVVVVVRHGIVMSIATDGDVEALVLDMDRGRTDSDENAPPLPDLPQREFMETEPGQKAYMWREKFPDQKPEYVKAAFDHAQQHFE